MEMEEKEEIQFRLFKLGSRRYEGTDRELEDIAH